MTNCRISFITLLFCLVRGAVAAPPDRIAGPVDAHRVRALAGNVSPLAKPQFDQGAVDAGMRMPYILLMIKPTAAQQAELDQVLVDQQNPSSARFRKWLTPEQFGDRFGLSSGDQAKIAAWLEGEGFRIKAKARGGNWIAFTGTAGQVSKSLNTSIHTFLVDGRKHYANASSVSVPEALSGMVAGFIGLNDFRLKPAIRLKAEYTTGSTHYLAPQDFETIYDITPLTTAGLDGTGTSIAVVGASDPLLTDLQAFTKRYGLPAENPTLVLYDQDDDPGITDALPEVDLDLEWSHAIAPGATIDYVYGEDPVEAVIYAVDEKTAPIITSSYGGCESLYDPLFFEAVAQQANAEGITIFNASGDLGAAGCDMEDPAFATQGLAVTFPDSLPEVTSVGGTEFVEGSGTYWSKTNSSGLGSATGYIPETAWNESGATGIAASTGGASIYHAQPVWQTGPGVPNDGVRHIPDIAFSAAMHDGYLITYEGENMPVGGTSAATPSMAGVLALLNQYLMTNGVISQPGLGNINPQLYRMAQSAPTAFHDVVTGNNTVLCAQGSPDCLAGSFGYNAGAGYDMATGLGSIDVNVLATNWNAAVNGVTVTVTANAAKVSSNASIQLTATVAAASGSGTPTGTVAFSSYSALLGNSPLGTAPVTGGTAGLTIPSYVLGYTGTFTIYATYSGDTAFSIGAGSVKIQVTSATGAASIIPSAPTTVWPGPADATGLTWQTPIELLEMGGVAAMLTGFSLDGQALPVAQYFTETNILPKGALSATINLQGLTAPMSHTLGFSGVDADGNNWSVQAAIFFTGAISLQGAAFTATPLIVTQNPAAPASCQWAVELHLDDTGGVFSPIDYLFSGPNDISGELGPVFGTSRLAAYGSLAGTLCFGGIKPPANETITYELDDGSAGDVTVTFAGPPTTPIQISTAPSSLQLAGAAGQPAQATLAVGLSDPAQQWTASVFPANLTSSWLSVSQLSGTGPGQITVTANGSAFEPGVYQATIVVQSANAIPQTVAIPVMFVNGGSGPGTAISGVANTASASVTTGAPGMLLAIMGSGLANASASVPAKTDPYPFSLGGVSATVNGQAAPIVSVSPAQVVIQIPYEAGAGPAVVGVNNNGQIAGFQFQIAPAAPAVYVDANGNLTPIATVKQGGNATALINGAGDIPMSLLGELIETGYSGEPGLAPGLPISVTVGGVQAFLTTTTMPSAVLGETQVNFVVPKSVPAGPQPVVVTVGGVVSQAANLTVTQ